MERMVSINPSTNEIIWEGHATSETELEQILTNSRKAQLIWSGTSLSERKDIINGFAQLVKENAEDAAAIIAKENGKPFWEAKMEVNSLVNKVQVVFDAYEERAKEKTKEMSNGRLSYTRYKPYGVMAVLGPYNFPMSMPNSHIMPALYAGNTVVFKPSERTPLSAEFYYELWIKAGLPENVLQIVNGDGGTGTRLIQSDQIDGVLFIGSYNAGKSIEKLMTKRNKLCALEMGGSSPLVVWDYSDIRAAINIAIQSAYVSTGQRCSAARRLIVNEIIYDEYISALKESILKIRIGDSFANPAPFMGPMIDERAVNTYLNDYNELVKAGAVEICKSERLLSVGVNFVSPGLIDVTGIGVNDKEVFGPLLQVVKVKSLDEAIEVSNNTQYGLAAGIVTESKDTYMNFFNNVIAGIINWNQPLTGSTTVAPFGGVKGSGNGRPAGYLSVDYCVYPVASIETENAVAPEKLSPGLEF